MGDFKKCQEQKGTWGQKPLASLAQVGPFPSLNLNFFFYKVYIQVSVFKPQFEFCPSLGREFLTQSLPWIGPGGGTKHSLQPSETGQQPTGIQPWGEASGKLSMLALLRAACPILRGWLLVSSTQSLPEGQSLQFLKKKNGIYVFYVSLLIVMPWQ